MSPVKCSPNEEALLQSEHVHSFVHDHHVDVCTLTLCREISTGHWNLGSHDSATGC